MNFTAIMPEIILSVGGLLVMALEAIRSARGRSSGTGPVAATAALVLLAAMIQVALHIGTIDTGFMGMVVSDPFADFFRVIITLGAFLTILFAMGIGPGDRAGNNPPVEYYALLLFAVVGANVLVIGSNLITIFLGLEIMSIPLYVMAACRTRDDRSVESGAKYFFTGAFASGFLAFGIALVYGASGTFSLDLIVQNVRSGLFTAADAGVSSVQMMTVGLIFIMVGFLFKIAAVPFHAWAPDVYQGAPTAATAFLAAVPKVAAIGFLLRFYLSSFGAVEVTSLWIAASLLSMLVGNFLALRQRDIKRMLAYSSIAHVGYALLGLVAGGSEAVGAVGFYLFGYTAMTVGAFAAVGALESATGESTIDALSGFGRTSPAVAVMLSVFMFALGGIPPTIGFVGKFLLFTAALRAGHTFLVVAAVIFSAVSVYYYIRVVVHAWMTPAADTAATPPPATDPDGTTGIFWPVLALATAIVLMLGIFPARLIELAAQSLFWSL